MVDFSFYLVLILLLAALMQSSHGFADEAKECVELKELFKKQRFLTHSERALYCKLGCSFVRGYECSAEEDVTGMGWLRNITSGLERFAHKAADPEEDVDIPEFAGWAQLAEDGYVFWSSFWHLFPYLLSLIPFGAARVLKEGSLQFICIMYWIVSVSIYNDKWVFIINASVHAYVCAFSPVNSRMFQDLLLTYFSVLMLGVISSVSSNMVVQISVGLSVGCLLVAQFWRGISGKNEQNKLFVIISITQMSIVCEYLHYLISVLAVNSFSMGCVKVVIEAILPYGPFRSVLSNYLSTVVYLAQNSTAGEKFNVTVFWVGSVVYWFLLVLSRAGIGVAVLSSLRFEVTPHTFGVGLYSYCIDLLDPWFGLFNVFSGEKMAHRKAVYSFVMVVLMCAEFWFGVEIILMRICLYVLDAVVLHSGLRNVSKFLDMEFDFKPIAFPKFGAFPFMCLDTVMDIRNNCVEVVSTEVDAFGSQIRRTRGVGLLRCDDRGMSSLYTVKHVTQDASEIRAGEHRLSNPSQTTVGRSVDPVVSMRIPGNGGTGVSNLVQEEVRDVQMLFVLHFSGPCAPIRNFKFLESGDLEASVNVMQGDSGAPIIALLSNGQLRFVGALSRGSFDQGQGNFISTVLGDQRDRSPGGVSPYFHVSEGKVSSFSATAKLREEILDSHNSLDNFLDENLDNWRDYRNVPDDDLPEDFRKRKKDRVKNWKKDRAFNKRRLLVEAYLRILEVDEVVKNMTLKAYDEGRIVDFNFSRRRQTFT